MHRLQNGAIVPPEPDLCGFGRERSRHPLPWVATPKGHPLHCVGVMQIVPAVAIESGVRRAARRSRRPDSPRTTGHRPVGLHVRAFSSFLSSSDVGFEAQDSRAGTFPRPQVRAHETPVVQAHSVVYVASSKKVTVPFFLAAYQCGNSTVYFQIRARPLLVF